MIVPFAILAFGMPIAWLTILLLSINRLRRVGNPGKKAAIFFCLLPIAATVVSLYLKDGFNVTKDAFPFSSAAITFGFSAIGSAVIASSVLPQDFNSTRRLDQQSLMGAAVGVFCAGAMLYLETIFSNLGPIV